MSMSDTNIIYSQAFPQTSFNADDTYDTCVGTTSGLLWRGWAACAPLSWSRAGRALVAHWSHTRK